MIPASSTERIASVDAVRLVSILVVFAVHLHASGLVVLPDAPWLRTLWLDFARNGSYGVSLFFVISGFVITRTILRRSPVLASVGWRSFYARRVGRILPLLGLVVVAGALALRLVPDASPRVEFCLRDPRAALDGAFWLSLFSFSFNWLRIARESTAYGFGLHWDVMWSLAIEEQFYLAYPILLRFARTRTRVVTILFAVVLLGPLWRAAATVRAPESFLWGFTSSPAAFDLIAMGALLCLFLERFPSSSGSRLEAALGITGAAVVVGTYVLSSLDQPWDRVWGPSLLGLGLVAFLGAALRRSWLESRLWHVVSTPGQWSYGGYLLHGSVLFALWDVLQGRSALSAFGLFAAATLAVSMLVYRFYEAPANRLVRSWLRAA